MTLQSIDLVIGTVYDIELLCTTPGPDDEEGWFRGYWTGEVDWIGKRTFQPINGQPLYLFDKDIVSINNI